MGTRDGRGGIEPERLRRAWDAHDLPDVWGRLLAVVESARAAVEGTPEGRKR
jgi:hypothetical protein